MLGVGLKFLAMPGVDLIMRMSSVEIHLRILAMYEAKKKENLQLLDILACHTAK